MKEQTNKSKYQKIIPKLEGAHCSLLSDFDISLFGQGTHYELYRHLGAHEVEYNGVKGIYFSVWAPHANYVSVIGEFNNWDKSSNVLSARWDSSGIWEGFIDNALVGQSYKFHIGTSNGYSVDKADPFGFTMEIPPHTASKISKTDFKWTDTKWITKRNAANIVAQPMSVYEVHIGSWRRVPEEGNRWLTYRELAEQLPSYCKDLGFTHVELMPVMEHPFFGSWGYQLTGYFAPSSRFGTVDDFKLLINELHKNNIGVILDWVPSHFPGDEHGLYFFDGSHLYEHADPKEGYHPDWSSYIFNYGRNEVRSFLISNAVFWLKEFHIDGLRVDAVASMLYRDYSRKEGEWIPNKYGGRENLEAITFLQELNTAVHSLASGAFTVAEESTAFKGVTASVADGGLGFDFKWMMGWMHDTLNYLQREPQHRSWHQDQLSFSTQYAFTEKFTLPLSHDEVVHGKHSLLSKMPGDEWQQMANLRMLYGYMYGHPGAKLLFMGAEFGQIHEWQHDFSLDWNLLENSRHKGLQHLVKDLNHLYTNNPALYTKSYVAEGFEWIDHKDHNNSVFCWLRKGTAAEDHLIFVANCQPNVHNHYRIGIPQHNDYVEILNTDSQLYGGSNVKNIGVINCETTGAHHLPFSIDISLPPLAVIVLQPNPLQKQKTKPSKTQL